MLKIDHYSPVPLCAQVEQLLRKLIQQDGYAQGTLLPNEIKLAAQLGVSRGTIRAGISKLVNEGLLERKAGVGTRICDHRPESGISAWRSFSREMAAKGIKVQNFKLDYRQLAAPPEIARGLQISSDTPVWRLERLRGWDEQPMLYSTSWFHPRLSLKGQENFNRPLYEVLAETVGVRPSHAREEFLAIAAKAEAARLLRIPHGAPLLLRRHVVFDSGHRAIEFAEVLYVSSRFTLTLDLHQEM